MSRVPWASAATKGVAAAFVLAAALACIGCAGDGDGAEPLTLEQRLLLESEAPGAERDPVEGRHEATNLDEFLDLGEEAFHRAAHVERSKYADAGFVSAIQDTRFYPKTPGDKHTRNAPHVRLLVMQLESEEGANTVVELLEAEGKKPCPGDCAVRITEFDVDGPPGARGLRHLTTAEELRATGAMGEPADAYSVTFSDGSFAYEIEMFGPPGAVSEGKLEAMARKFYDRIEGAPAPET